MKKLLLLLFIFPFVISCSDNDDPTLDENLIGKWYIKPDDISSIDTIEFTSDFKYRESRYDFKTKTSSWSDWMDYSLVNEFNIYIGKNGLVIFLENVKYPYRIDQEKGKTILWTKIRGMKEGYSAIFTKVE